MLQAKTSPCDAPPGHEADRWFAQHLQPHEAMLRAWLHSLFPSGAEIDDIVQEAYVRVFRARQRCELSAPKAFLFATARNLAIDQLRRRRAVPMNSLVEMDEVSVLDECAGIPETVAHSQELELLNAAIQSLPGRCREIFTLRRIQGLSQAEIAVRLGVSPHTVSAQLSIGLHKCMLFLERYRRERASR